MTTLLQTLEALERRPMRTFLTALGTALGIATIVALLAVSGGAQASASKFLNLGSSDLGLFQRDAADPTTSVLPLALVGELRHTRGIQAATPLVLLVGAVHRAPGAIAFGAYPDSFVTDRYVFLAGRMFTGDRQVAVGSGLAAQLHLQVGDTLTIAHHRLSVSGIYHMGVPEQDDGAVIAFGLAQKLAGKVGEATTVAVSLAPTVSRTQGIRTISRRFPGLLILGDGVNAPRTGVSGVLLSRLALVLAVIALVIGGVGVMNTMLMSVLERRTEFALLAAVGWSGPQIAMRVMAEGILTSIIGAGLGLLLGVVGAQLLVGLLGASEYVAPNVTAWDLGQALLVGVLLGVLGGMYPAWRAARLSPAKVLAER
ncbi:ABC transporter permease [Conexibacter sp. S30A1]|uniref:ABC transporter permease n=1 Tax=Conexibacter sp. S30A1 TaxID=2937800 RepID=UPI0020100AF8|nr:ABC transporter permease [Conexibacter sp. S30A1]